MNNQKFKMFANCIAVQGYKRGIIYDLNRKSYEFIPNSMVDFIAVAENTTTENIKATYSEEFHSIIDEYLHFLNAKEFSFWITPLLADNFSQLNKEWDYPAQITNAIIDIDIDFNSKYDIESVLKQLEELGCKHIQIRAYCIKQIKFYDDLLSGFINSSYLSFEIITQFNENEQEQDIKQFIKKHKRVKAIIFHSSSLNEITNDTENYSMGNVAYTQQKINSPNDCQNNNNTAYFNISVELFTEAQQHNTYFNRKISIDVNGNIKNCTSQDKIFGNVKTDKILDVISTSEFQKLWFVKKDGTKVCNDCEFRYMCTDSRTPHQNADGMWEHKEECNYNPYIAKWKRV